MGNCQAIDAAALVIQHPNGRLERMYWPVTACEIMRLNPGHYVSLIIPIPVSEQRLQTDDTDNDNDTDNDDDQHENTDKRIVRFTRVKLLRPEATLLLGHAYRLVTSQEVMKVLRAKKSSKLKRNQIGSAERSNTEDSACESESKRENPQLRKCNQLMKQEKPRARAVAPLMNVSVKPKTWRPTLQSILETGN